MATKICVFVICVTLHFFVKFHPHPLIFFELCSRKQTNERTNKQTDKRTMIITLFFVETNNMTMTYVVANNKG